MSVIMPEGANIPYEWTVGRDNGRLIIVVPSWSQTQRPSYIVTMDAKTRELWCECKGFEIRRDCHHVRGLVWFCAGPKFRKKGVQMTSLVAWNMLKSSLGERQKTVFDALQILEKATNKQLAAALTWPINCITPRVLELRNMGLVDYAGTRTDETTQRVEMVWMAVL